jgi:hypothetical protein
MYRHPGANDWEDIRERDGSYLTFETEAEALASIMTIAALGGQFMLMRWDEAEQDWVWQALEADLCKRIFGLPWSGGPGDGEYMA